MLNRATVKGQDNYIKHEARNNNKKCSKNIMNAVHILIFTEGRVVSRVQRPTSNVVVHDELSLDLFNVN